MDDDLRRIESIDVVPPGWLHLTLLEVGYADEVTEVETAALVTAAQAVAEMLPLELELGPITTMTDAVVLQVAESLPLAALQATLAEGLLASRGEQPDHGLVEPFWPHVSLGYVNRDSSRDEVLTALGGEVSRTITVSVPRLTLAAVTRMDDHYRWSAVAVPAAHDRGVRRVLRPLSRAGGTSAGRHRQDHGRVTPTPGEPP